MEKTKKPHCKCGRICQWYVGRFSKQCKTCNKSDAEKKREARASRGDSTEQLIEECNRRELVVISKADAFVLLMTWEPIIFEDRDEKMRQNLLTQLQKIREINE
jgi:hypothetical protein